MHKTYRAINKYRSHYKNDIEYINNTKINHSVLLDIAKCRCYSRIASIDNINDIKCKCTQKFKIPSEKREFYVDQNTERSKSVFFSKNSVLPEPNKVKPKSLPNSNQIKREYGNYDNFITCFDDSFEETL